MGPTNVLELMPWHDALFKQARKRPKMGQLGALTGGRDAASTGIASLSVQLVLAMAKFSRKGSEAQEGCFPSRIATAATKLTAISVAPQYNLKVACNTCRSPLAGSIATACTENVLCKLKVSFVFSKMVFAIISVCALNIGMIGGTFRLDGKLTNQK